MRIRHAIAAACAGAAVAVGVAACGVQTQNAGSPTQTIEDPGTSTTLTAPRRNSEPLPAAPDDTVRVDGLRGGVSDTATDAFSRRSDTDVALIRAPDPQAFGDLCAGRVDVIETSRLPTAEEIQTCRRRGIEMSEPLQIGADAIVLATKNEADVGGDCVTVQQARDIFRAGSPYTNWSQLGFDDLPLITTGREEGSPNFELFGQVVLGVPNPSLADVRTDYRVRRSDRSEREEITGTLRVRRAEQRVAAYLSRLRRSARPERRRVVQAARDRADRRVLREINAENRRRSRRGVTLTVAQAAAIEARNLERVTRAKSAAARAADARFDARLQSRARAYGRTLLAEARAPGVVGPFRFSYYELFEDQLRPLEIDYGVPVLASGQPVTLDDLRAEDRRRLEEALERTTPQTVASDQTFGTAPSTTTPTTTVPTAQTIPQLPAGQLPKKTRDGETIYPGPNCVFPSQVTITSGAYPLAKPLYLFSYPQALARPEVREYLTFFVGNSRSFATSLRLVPITDQQLADQLAIVENGGRRPPPSQPRPQGTVTTRTVTTPQGTTTVQTVTVPPPTTVTTPTPPADSGIPGVSSGRPSGG